MRRTAVGGGVAVALLIAFLGGISGGSAVADGGRLRVMHEQGDYQVSVFTSPNPLRAGPIDVSVLVQNTKTGQAVSDVGVIVEIARPGESPPLIRTVATTDTATNKLFHAALIELPAPGLWDVGVECSIPRAGSNTSPLTEFRFPIEAAPPLPHWLLVWPWFAWPIGAVLLFALHRKLVARRTSDAAPRDPAPAKSAIL